MKVGITEGNPRGTGGMKCPAAGTAETVLPPNIAAAFYFYLQLVAVSPAPTFYGYAD